MAVRRNVVLVDLVTTLPEVQTVSGRNVVLVDLVTMLPEVQTVSGRNVCGIFDTMCHPVDIHSTILKQSDGFVATYISNTHTSNIMAVID